MKLRARFKTSDSEVLPYLFNNTPKSWLAIICQSLRIRWLLGLHTLAVVRQGRLLVRRQSLE